MDAPATIGISFQAVEELSVATMEQGTPQGLAAAADDQRVSFRGVLLAPHLRRRRLAQMVSIYERAGWWDWLIGL